MKLPRVLGPRIASAREMQAEIGGSVLGRFQMGVIAMDGFVRRAGIALGSLVAGMLCVGFVGGIGMMALGIGASPLSGTIATIASAVLGWLIYRDILRRERRTAWRSRRVA